MMNGRALLALVILAITLPVSPPAQAAKIAKLYEIRLPVTDQQRNKRFGAYREALEMLLVRITGDPTISAKPGIEDMLKAPLSYLSRFNYSDLPTRWEGKRNDKKQLYTQQIEISFDENAINKKLRELKLPIWSSTRPSVLMWIVVQDEEMGRTILDENQGGPLIEAIMDEAEIRGVPLLFPLWDLQDQLLVTTEDIWANFDTGVLDASKRYDADTIVIGRVSRDLDGKWQSRWTLHLDSEQLRLEAEGKEAAPVIIASLNAVTDQLAKRFAHVTDDEQSAEYLVHVKNLSTLEAYMKASKYLDSLEPVQAVRVDSVESDNATFRVKLRTDRKGLEKAISLGAVLLATNEDKDFQLEQHFYYKLR